MFGTERTSSTVQIETYQGIQVAKKYITELAWVSCGV